MRYTSLPALLLGPFAPFAAATAQQDSVRYTRQVYPEYVVVQRGDELWRTCRVVDDLTGEPIAGAEVHLVPEHDQPLAGRFWSDRSAKSDADGFVRIRGEDARGWTMLFAPGYGPAANCGGMREMVWRLAPAHDVPVLVRDWRGAPVPGARIGFCIGCGHTPDVANGTSGRDGIAWLRGVDPLASIGDLYAQHDDLGLGYHTGDWHPGDPPFVFDCPPAVPLFGRLVDANGKPLANVPVGTRDVHRGPWAMTDAEGNFRVLGADLRSDLLAVFPDREVLFARPASFPAVLHVPAANSASADHGTIEPAKAEPAPPTASVAVRATGRVEGQAADASPPELEVRTPTGPLASEAGDAEGTVRVPATGPFALVLRVEWQYRVFPFADRKALPPEPIVLPWFSPTHVTGRLVDADGKPVAARLRLRGVDASFPDEAVPCTDGTFDLLAKHVGASHLEIVPERSDLCRTVVACSLPHRADGARLDLGVLRLSPTPQITVRDAKGAPLAGAAAKLVRSGFRPHPAELDANGAWLDLAPRAGDAFVVDLPHGDDEVALPFRTVLRGDGPWTLQMPAGRLDLQVRDEQGAPVVAFVFVADESIYHQTDLHLIGLRPGPQRLFVVAEHFQTAIVTTTIPATGPKSLRVTLPRL